MKLRVLFTIAILGILVLIGLTGCLSRPAEKIEKHDYIIEQLTPEIIRLTAFSKDINRDQKGSQIVGYGDALAEGIKEIGKKYKIIAPPTPLVYARYAESYVNQLLIMVEPRK